MKRFLSTCITLFFLLTPALHAQREVVRDTTLRFTFSVPVDTVLYPDTVLVPSEPDTVYVPTASVSGVDTTTYPDSLKLAYWHTGKIQDSVRVFLIAKEPTSGRTLGPSGLLADNGEIGVFTQSTEGAGPAYILSLLNEARQKNVKLLLNMTGGKHSNYMSTIDGVYQFDRTKWEARMDAFNTGEIREAVAAAVRDGVIIGNSVMDEPHVSGAGDGNTWGPKGTMTKARVDSLCAYARAIFPTLPMGVVHQWQAFEPTKSYYPERGGCQFFVSQYSTRSGEINAWVSSALDMAQRDGIRVMFSMNILNGGTQDKDGTWDCKDQGGVKGTYSPNCAMTPYQIRTYGKKLVSSSTCGGLMLWRHNATFLSRTGVASAMNDLGLYTANLAPAGSCRR